MSMSYRLLSIYYMLFLVVVVVQLSIKTAMGQALAPAPELGPAPAPAPPGPLNITAVLEKGGHFMTLIRLLRSTQVESQINSQLNNSNNGMTVLAPSDNAFTALPSGTLNNLTEQNKLSLIQFHILTTFLSLSQFQTVSNPLHTLAGNTGKYQFPINVTTFGNQVNISTGINDATISGTVYTDNQLAVYQVDKVLLPLSVFGPQPPAPAPAPAVPKKKSAAAALPLSDVNSSGDMGLRCNAVVSLVVAAVGYFWL